jgi:hypothetical protein
MMRLLTDYEYLELLSGGQRSRSWYSLRSDDSILHADLSMIPSPETLKAFTHRKKQ